MKPMADQRRSSVVMLTLIGLPLGVMGIAHAIPDAQEMRRNLYADRAACERDYTPQQCEARSASSGGGWHGPFYLVSHLAPGRAGDPGPGRGGTIIGTETSMRGGFGHFGHAMRAIG